MQKVKKVSFQEPTKSLTTICLPKEIDSSHMTAFEKKKLETLMKRLDCISLPPKPISAFELYKADMQ
jgi:hypothetical protein